MELEPEKFGSILKADARFAIAGNSKQEPGRAERESSLKAAEVLCGVLNFTAGQA